MSVSVNSSLPTVYKKGSLDPAYIVFAKLVMVVTARAVQLAMKAVPYHKDFLKYLGSDGTAGGDDQVTQDMAQFADSLGILVTIITLLYQEHNLDPL